MLNLDETLFHWSNVYGSFLQASGTAYLGFSNLMALNPFLSPISQEIEKWGQYMIERGRPMEAPTWQTPNQKIYEGFKVTLRKFNSNHRGEPIIFVAPEAGHNAHIVDYGPSQSLIQCALEYYPGDIYALDKLPAGPEHTTYDIDDCIRSLEACVDAIGEPVHLVGLCQGGWQSAIFTALFPNHVKSLTLAAAPIDFHAGDAIIAQWAEAIPLSTYEQMVQLGQGNMPGCFIVQGFMLMNPYDRFVGDDVNLWKNITDAEFIDRHRRFAQWYYYTQAVPGTMYINIVKKLFKENRLIRGELEILGQKVDLGQITQPLYMVGGEKDDITPPAQLFAAEHYVRSKIIRKAVLPAGHIGVFMGKKVIQDYWRYHLATLVAETRNEGLA